MAAQNIREVYTGPMKSYNVSRIRKIVEQYTNSFNPYESRPSIGIDLLALTRYAKANNKKPENMSEAELSLFKMFKNRKLH